MYYSTCFSFSWSRKHMCASFVLRSIEDWWKPLRDILILFRRDMCKLYEPQEFPRASEESIHSMQYESTSALLLEITFRIIWTRVCFFPNRQICSWFFLETKHHLQKKKPKPLHQNHTSGGRFSTKSVRLGLSPMANFKQISTTFPVMTLRCFHPIPKLHTPPAFRRMKPQFLVFFCGTKMRKNWKQSELPQKEKSMPKVFMVEWKPLESCWIWKGPPSFWEGPNITCTESLISAVKCASPPLTAETSHSLCLCLIWIPANAILPMQGGSRVLETLESNKRMCRLCM